MTSRRPSPAAPRRNRLLNTSKRVMILAFQGSEAEGRDAISRALDIDEAVELDRGLATRRAAQLFDEDKAERAMRARHLPNRPLPP